MNKIKLLFVLLLLAITNSNAQFVTLDYSSFTSSSCDVFENFTTFQGILHQTKRGDITKNSSQGGLELKYVYNGGGTNQKGSEFALSGITFKKDFKYIVKITAKSNGNYGEPAGLKCNFNPFGIDPQCNGVNFVNQPNGTFGFYDSDWFQNVNGTAFVEYTFTSDYLITALSSLGIGTFSRSNISFTSNFSQTIFIKKIVISEIPPPPSFTLSPTTVSLACGDTAARSFTVTPANIPAGAVVTYNNWSALGWTQVGSNTNPRTFQPSSGTSLPSNVSVTPFIDGVAQTQQVCTVTRAPFTSTATISGNVDFCSIQSQNVYTINAGIGNTVFWSSSDVTKAIVSSQSNSQATITSLANGKLTLTASITNQCGQNIIKSITIGIGQPQITDVAITNSDGGDDFCVNIRGKNIARFTINTLTPNIVRYQYRILRGTTVIEDVTINNSNNSFSGAVNPLGIAGSYTLECRIENSCGWSPWEDYGIFFVRCSTTNRLAHAIESSENKQYIVYPNPSKNLVNVVLSDKDNPNAKQLKKSAELFDIVGKSKSKFEISDNKATFSVQGLKKGIYVLKIYSNDHIETHNISVE